MSAGDFKIFYSSTVHLLKTYVLGIIVFTFFRTALLIAFGNVSEFGEYKFDLLRAYWVGFRFDTSVLAYGFLLLFSLDLFILIVPRADNYYKAVKKFAFWYILTAFAAFLTILFTDFFYFMFFQSHFNELFFGIARGETKAVLTSVWRDYPVISICAIIVMMIVLTAWLVSKILKKDHNIAGRSPLFRKAFVIVWLGSYLLALHGSLGPAPLSRDRDSYVSSNIFLNDLTLNGVVALKEAFSDEKKRRTLINTGNENNYHALEFVNTPERTFLKNEPPHVVFILMESMSNYYLDLHSPQLNLMGTLEEQLPHCIVFRNFLPAGNGTIQSLEALMVSNLSVSLPEAQSSVIDKPLSSSVALPFLRAGYHATFITGGNLRFCSLDKFASGQYFQTVEGSETLSAKVKNAEAGTWGVHDEFLFERVFDKLRTANGKPQFIFAVTISNHTPFDLPRNYRPFPLQISPEILKKTKTSEELAMKHFAAYQYANDSLGRFLERLRNSRYGENTIVAVTGDHNTLQLFNFPYTRLFQKLSVPLILYVPAKYKPPCEVDTLRFASHKDVFPTLFNLALSDATYLKTGNNLLDVAEQAKNFFAINDNTAMDKNGAVLIQDRPFFYRWQGKNRDLLEPTSLLKTPELEPLLKTSLDYRASVNAFIKKELSQ